MYKRLLFLAPAFPFALAAAPEPDWSAGGEHHIQHSVTSSQDIQLQQPLTLNIDHDRVVSLHGAISSPPAGLQTLIKNGAGRLELWGENMGMEKEVSLREGSLHLAGRHALGPDWWSSLHVHAGTTLSYEANATVAASLHLQNAIPGGVSVYDPAAIEWNVSQGTTTQIGTILGTIPLVKTGDGTLRLQNASLLPDSRLTVAEGTVQLNAHFAGRINVRNAATLSGSGHTGTLIVEPGGILAPTGRLNVGSSLHLHADSWLHLRAWADGRHDSVHVQHGMAQLDGHILVVPQDDARHWQHGTEAVIVQTRDGLGNSRFASVQSALPYLEPDLDYTSHQVILKLRPRVGDRPPVPEGMTAGWAASVRNMLADDSRFIRTAVYTHGAIKSSDYLADPVSSEREHEPDADTRRPGFWSHSFHSSGDHRPAGGSGGMGRHISGLLLGVNLDVAPAWRLGILAGGSRTTAHGHQTPGMPHPAHAHNAMATTSHNGARIDSIHLGLHAHHQTTWGSQLTAGLAYSRHRIYRERQVSTPALHDSLSSRYRAHTTQIFGRIQHPLWVSRDQHSRLEPFVGLAWVRTQQAAHTEHGGPLAIQMPSGHTSVLFSTIGLATWHRLSLPQGTAILEGALSWQHASGDTHASMRQHFRDDIHRATLHAKGTPVHRQAWQLQLGLQADISKHAKLGIHYTGHHARQYRDHGVQLGLAARW